MMKPDPEQRPTAEQLLSHPKLQYLQKKRKSLMNFSMLVSIPKHIFENQS